MATTNFSNGQTPIVAEWLNDVDAHTYDQSTLAHTSSHITYTQGGTGSVGTTVQSKLRETVSVKDFGAVGDGVTDDTAAIQAALNSGAKRVLVPFSATEYIVGTELVVPTGVSFIGEGNPTIKAKSGAFSSGGSVISAVSVSDVVVRGFIVDANRQNITGVMNGIYTYNCTKTLVDSCQVKNTEYGIRFTNGNTNRITNNVVDDCLYYGISVKLSSTSDSAYNYIITGNECKNIASDLTSGADGQGIVVYGATGLTAIDYKNIKKVIVSNNVCSNCAAHGITLIAVSDFVVSGNNCYDCLQNTSFGSGICVSEACKNGTVSNNTCTNNYDAGILLDVVDQAGDRFSYGYLAVTGNSCDSNTRTGIKINSMPHSTISGNNCSGGLWGIFLAKGGFNTLSGNTLTGCTQNAIRLPGVTGATGDDQTHVIIADNMIKNCGTLAGDQYSAIFLDYFNTVKIQNNDFKGCTQDLTVQSTCSNISLLDNRFTGDIYIDTSVSITRWDDEFRNSASAKTFYSTDFGGSGTTYFRVDAGFTIPHFGREWIPILSISPVTSSLTTAIHPGYTGQRISLINYNTNNITIKHGASTNNIGNVDIVLAYGELVEFVWRGNEWLQTTAKILTSL